jgi:excisionase family DNA binding protein
MAQLEPTPTPDLMLEEQLAAYLQISTRKIRALRAEGKLPFVKIGSLVRYQRKDIDVWLESISTNPIEKQTATAVELPKRKPGRPRLLS